MKKPIKITVLWLLVAACMTGIFMFSAQTGDESSGVSEEVAYQIVRLTTPSFDGKPTEEKEAIIDGWQFTIRKTAHWLMYLLLGLLTITALRAGGAGISRSAWLAFLISVAYACSDEWHQLFIDGRSGQFTDVLIDAAGAAAGICIAALLMRQAQSRRARRGTVRG